MQLFPFFLIFEVQKHESIPFISLLQLQNTLPSGPSIPVTEQYGDTTQSKNGDYKVTKEVSNYVIIFPMMALFC